MPDDAVVTTPTAPPRIRQIPALDGMRGLAQIVIMLFHGGVLLTAGGFYAVDMFFTLSGFLITSLLIAEWRRTGTIDRRTFYARRARRLLPALCLTLIGVAIWERYLIAPGTYPGLRDDALSAMGFVANWHFWHVGTDYFTRTGLTSPLLHTWSLGVEEQFYLIWPLAMFLVVRRTKSLRALLAISLVLSIASAIEMAVLFHPDNPNRAFYGTDTRAQALMIGCALGCGLALRGDKALSARGRVGLTGLGVAGIAGSILLWATVSATSSFAYRGGFYAAGLACAAIIANVALDPRAITARVLSFPPLRYLGRISYGLYLWHFPLFAYLDASRVGYTRWPLLGVRSAATLAIATASFYLVEQPVRRGIFPRRRHGWAVTPAAIGVTIAAVFVGTTVPAIAIPKPQVPSSALYRGPPVRTLILGDSVALTVGIGMKKIAADYDAVESDKGLLGCGVVESSALLSHGIPSLVQPECNTTVPPPTPHWPQLWQGWVDDFHPDVALILVGRWEITTMRRGGRWTNIDRPSFDRYLTRQLERAVTIAGSTGARVVLLTAPCYSSGEQPDGTAWPEDSAQRLDRYNGIVRQIAAEHPATVSVIDFNALACPGGHYVGSIDHTQLRTSDGVHFTPAGAALLGETLWPQIIKLGRAHQEVVATTPSAGS